MPWRIYDLEDIRFPANFNISQLSNKFHILSGGLEGFFFAGPGYLR